MATKMVSMTLEDLIEELLAFRADGHKKLSVALYVEAGEDADECYGVTLLKAGEAHPYCKGGWPFSDGEDVIVVGAHPSYKDV